MSSPEELESEYEHERGFAVLDGLVSAQVDLDCAAVGCGLTIHEGDPIQLGSDGWCHPVCAMAEDVDAERRHDMRREG